MASRPVSVTQSSVFARAYKKLHLQQKQDVDTAVEVIVSDPPGGEAKFAPTHRQTRQSMRAMQP